jgi:hypothetical protein
MSGIAEFGGAEGIFLTDDRWLMIEKTILQSASKKQQSPMSNERAPGRLPSPQPVSNSGALDHAADPDQNDGTENGNQDGADEAGPVNAENAEDPSADDAADDAEDDIHDGAVASALHDFAGRPTRDQTNDDPQYET